MLCSSLACCSLKAMLSCQSLIRAEINFVRLPPSVSVSVWLDEDDNKSDKFSFCLQMWNCLQKSVKPTLLLKSAVTHVLLLIRSLGRQHWDLLSCVHYSIDDFCFQGLSHDFKVQVLEFSSTKSTVYAIPFPRMIPQKHMLKIQMRQSQSGDYQTGKSGPAQHDFFFLKQPFSKHIFLKGIKHCEYKKNFVAYDSVPSLRCRLTLAKGLQREQSFL